jgi:hypothetical protein
VKELFRVAYLPKAPPKQLTIRSAVNKIRALVIRTDNTTDLVEVPELEFSKLLGSVIDGIPSHVSIHETLDFWCDDEGLLKGLPINKVATQFYLQLGATSPIVGTAIFTGGGDGQGGTLPLSEHYATALQFAAKMANEF